MELLKKITHQVTVAVRSLLADPVTLENLLRQWTHHDAGQKKTSREARPIDPMASEKDTGDLSFWINKCWLGNHQLPGGNVVWPYTIHFCRMGSYYCPYWNIMEHLWLVVDLPLWKIWVRKLGWLNSQYMGKIKVMFQTTNQISIGSCNQPFISTGSLKSIDSFYLLQ